MRQSKAMTDERWGSIVTAMERRTQLVHAAAVIDPSNPERWGRVILTYPKNGVGKVMAVAWLPSTEGYGFARHYGWASGGGYDRATAAMGGACYTSPNGTAGALVDQGTNWQDQLRAAGFIVVGVC